MNTKDVARHSYHLATSLEECPFNSFWVVLLDDGTEVYQTDESADLSTPSPWLRLKKFCAEQKRKIRHMAYASRDGSVNQINCVPDAAGYFFAKRIRTLAAPDPRVSGYTDHAVGVGYLRHNILSITWMRNDGVVEEEHRDFSTKLGQLPPSLITS